MATDSTATDRELDVITLAAAPIILDEMYTIDEAEDALLYHLVNSFNTQCIISSQRKDASRNRKFRQRREWSWFSHYMSHRQFRRYFRMTNDCFTSLCNRIATNHGEHQFRSEDYINNLYLLRPRQRNPLMIVGVKLSIFIECARSPEFIN
jgi:hypothetical protein